MSEYDMQKFAQELKILIFNCFWKNWPTVLCIYKFINSKNCCNKIHKCEIAKKKFKNA